MKLVAFNLAVLVLFAGCASSTVIRSTPDGAKLYLNDEYVGKTPYNHEDTKIVGTRTSVRIEKEGYETLYTNFARNEEADVGAIVGGFLFLFPFLWFMGYKPSHLYELVPLGISTNSTSGYEKEISESDSLTKKQYDQLIKLKELLDKGIITQEEFNKEKSEILDN